MKDKQEFLNPRIISGNSKEYFEITRILDKNLSIENSKRIKNFIENMCISNQECIRVLENINSQSVLITRIKPDES